MWLFCPVHESSRILETNNSGFSLPISSAFSHLASLCMPTWSLTVCFSCSELPANLLSRYWVLLEMSQGVRSKISLNIPIYRVWERQVWVERFYSPLLTPRCFSLGFSKARQGLCGIHEIFSFVTVHELPPPAMPHFPMCFFLGEWIYEGHMKVY